MIWASPPSLNAGLPFWSAYDSPPAIAVPCVVSGQLANAKASCPAPVVHGELVQALI